MVTLDIVRASNAKLKALSPGLVAIFVGATSGIGESTLKQFYRQSARPHVYFIGRNKEAANRIISELSPIQPEGKLTFIQKDLTLLANVDQVCNDIKAKEAKINLLFMTPGTLSLKGRDETEEGFDRKLATNYYSRLRFINLLLPLLEAAAPGFSRVVSVLGAGEESPLLDLSNLDLKHDFTLKKASDHAITMTSLVFEELAKQHPSVSFIHTHPGMVKTGFAKEAGLITRLGMQALLVLAKPWMIDITESGERHLYVSTSGVYPARSNDGGVEVEGDTIKGGSNREIGSGCYLINSRGESIPNSKALEGLRQEGAGLAICRHTEERFVSLRGQAN